MVQRAGKTKSAIQNGQMKARYKPYYFTTVSTIIICVLIFLLVRRCGDGGTRHSGSDTIRTVIDTFFVTSKVDTHYIPKPYKVIEPYRVEVPANTDALTIDIANKEAIIADREDTIKALRDYLSTKYYADTQKVKYGTLVITDTVGKNKILGRGLSLNQRIPEITRTYTIEAQKRVVVYVGADVYGNLSSPLYAVGAAAGVKGRNDKSYEIKALLSKDGTPIYGFGYRIPIKLRKK